MTDFEPEEDLPPVAHVTLVYNGPVAPHWEMRPRYGDQKMLDDFWTRVHARLLLLPKHDPQFRRNRERVNRDAERERIVCDWDLGEGDAESTSTPSAMAPGADQRVAAPAPVEEPLAEADPGGAPSEEPEVEQPVIDEVPAAEVTADEVPAAEVTADEVPAAEVTADEVPAAEVTADEVPAAEVTEQPAVEEPGDDEAVAEDEAPEDEAPGDAAAVDSDESDASSEMPAGQA